MRLSRASALAVYAVTYMAQHEEEGPQQGREIARALGVPTDSMVKILQRLVRAGILVSLRGRSGGFHLGARPRDISLLQIVEAVDGPLDGRIMLGRIEGMLGARSGLERRMTEASTSLRKVLGRARIRDLLDD